MEDHDRLSENGSITEPEFNSLVTHTRHRLALIFHRYLSGKVRGKRLSMFLNGQELDATIHFIRKTTPHSSPL